MPRSATRAALGAAAFLTLALLLGRGPAGADEPPDPPDEEAPVAATAGGLAPGVTWTTHRDTPPDSLPDGRRRIAWLYFGSPTVRPPGADALGGPASGGPYAWAEGMIRLRSTRETRPWDMTSFVEGYDALFLAAIAPDSVPWRAVLTLGHPERSTGPVRVQADAGFSGEFRQRRRLGRTVAEGLLIPAHHAMDLAFELTPYDGRVGFRLSADSCDTFDAVCLALYAPRGAALAPHLDPAPRLAPATPPMDSLAALAPADRVTRLTGYANWLLRMAPAEGGFSYEGSWYQNAYAVRTLLAALATGSPSLERRPDDPLEAVRATLRAFVASQHADGSFPSRYAGQLSCLKAGAPTDSASRNLADVGSMVHALLLALPWLEREEARAALVAARRYADRIVLPQQLASGAFPNGRYDGQDYRQAYSVATGTQVSQLALLGALADERRYSDAAQRAARYLARSVREDGAVTFAPFNADTTVVKPATAFGDLFYVMEGITWAWTCARDSADRRLYRDALRRYAWGPAGLMAARINGVGWKPQDSWTNAKLPAMLFVLCRLRALDRSTPELDRAIDGLAALIGDLPRARQLGVLVDPIAPGGGYGLTATAFAGVGMAAACDAGLLVPRTARRPWTERRR